MLELAVYNPFLVYCRELAPGTVSLTCDRAQGDDSKYDSHYIIIGGTQIITNKRKTHLFNKIIHFSVQFSAKVNRFIVKT